VVQKSRRRNDARTGRNCSIALLQPDADHELQEVGRHRQDDFFYEDVAISGSLLCAAAHGDGLEIINISDPAHPFTVTTIASENAWAVRVSDGYAYLADGAGGLAVIDVAVPQQAALVAHLPLPGAAKDIRVRNGLAFLAVGDAGIAMVDLSAPENPLLANQYDTSGHAAHLGVSDSLVAVADWDDLEILRYDDSGTLELSGYKRSGGRVMGVEIEGDLICTAKWSALQIYRYGPIDGPDLDLGQTAITFPVLLGEPAGYHLLGGQSPYPRDFIIDADGIVQYAATEYRPTEMTTIIERLLPTSVGRGGDNSAPAPATRIELGRNRPNPFNPSTRTPFTLTAAAGTARLSIHSLDGKLVRVLLDQPLPPGKHVAQWDGLDQSGRVLTSGIYLYRLRAGDEESVGRMLLLK
jgi:hypothetical protein